MDNELHSDECVRVTFWSSVEYGAFASALVEALNARGICAKHRYHISQKSYRRGRRVWSRSWLRFRMYFSYPILLFFMVVMGDRHRIHAVCTNTFYAPFLALLGARLRGSRVIHVVYDLFPDALQITGVRMPLLTGILERITRKTMQHSAANVFLGDHIADCAQRRYGDIPNTVVIPIGADTRGWPVQSERASQSQKTTILYCGNMGRMHEVATLIELFEAEKQCATVSAHSPNRHSAIHFVFHAHGSGYTKLRDTFRITNGELPGCIGDWGISWGGGLDDVGWRNAMGAAEVALVTLKSGAERAAFPSKALSAMAAGQAVLAICEPDGDLARIIAAHRCGWVVRPHDIDAIRTVLRDIQEQPETLAVLRANARDAAVAYYDQAVLARKWEQVLRDALSHSPRRQ